MSDPFFTAEQEQARAIEAETEVGRLEAEVERLRQRLEQVKALSAEAVRAAEAEVKRLHRIEEAARDPFLVILESHHRAGEPANSEMRRAADRFRAALRETEAE